MPMLIWLLGLAVYSSAPTQAPPVQRVNPNIAKARPATRVLRTPTGNSVIDAKLANMLTIEQPCDNGMDAIQAAAAEIKNNPSKYLNPDGSVNTVALNKLIEEKQAEQKGKPC